MDLTNSAERRDGKKAYTARMKRWLRTKEQAELWRSYRYSGRQPQLETCLEYVREGDTLVVMRLDRLARSTLHLCQIGDELQRTAVNLQVLDQNIDTDDATGRLLFNVLGAIAQFETEIRTERQMDGIQKAKERGVHFGRKRRSKDVQIAEPKQRRDQGELIRTLMKEHGISKATTYRYLSLAGTSK